MAYYWRTNSRRAKATGAAVGVVLALAAHAGHAQASSHPAHASAGNATGAAAVAIRWAEHQIGCPYHYGGTGPCAAGYDCSGLLMMAYRAAGVSIPRTSEDDWANLPHVPASQRRAGDLVLAPGSPYDPPPGHVGMLTGRNTVIEAYATGVPVKIVSLSNFAATSGGITGYAEVR